jgi:hypothetical protein
MILEKTNTVHFDANNPEHRKAVAVFMKRNAWGDTSYRFSHDAAFGSVADQVKVKMLHWYIQQDTGITVASAERPLIGRSSNLAAVV